MTNIYKQQQIALSKLREILKNLPDEGANRQLLVMELLTVYAVSGRVLNNYIDLQVSVGALSQEGFIIKSCNGGV